MASIPCEGVTAEQYRPNIERIDINHVMLRGFERIARLDARIAATARDWCLKQILHVGGLGNLLPLNKCIRDD